MFIPHCCYILDSDWSECIDFFFYNSSSESLSPQGKLQIYIHVPIVIRYQFYSNNSFTGTDAPRNLRIYLFNLFLSIIADTLKLSVSRGLLNVYGRVLTVFALCNSTFSFVGRALCAAFFRLIILKKERGGKKLRGWWGNEFRIAQMYQDLFHGYSTTLNINIDIKNYT